MQVWEQPPLLVVQPSVSSQVWLSDDKTVPKYDSNYVYQKVFPNAG